ncbi:MAG: AMP-binding protein, partial [Acidobacteriota bacterium]
AAFAADLGCRPGDRCAILAENDARWLGIYLGLLRLGAVAVPLDTNYSPAQIRTVVADSGSRILFASPRHSGAAREATRSGHEAPLLVVTAGQAADCRSLDDSRHLRPLDRACPARPEDPAVILYTSGTTSDPKGVVLTHGNLLAERDAAFTVVPIDERDAILGVLPLFHALAQIANLLIPLTVGARIVFLETVNTSELMRGLQERGITAVCVVPQFFYLMHQRVSEQVRASRLPVRVLFRAMLTINGWLRGGFGINLGRILFRLAHRALGDRIRILVTGGSRFDPVIGRDLFRLGFNIVQAYGLTECSGAATVTRQGDPHIESVGQPLPGVQLRILDDQGLGEREHPDGEVLIKGPIVMAGYHNRPDATAETLRDGWLHSGDLGYLDRDGRLHITGRKKDVIVLASGKNIYPEEIEAQLARSPFIKEVCVLGVSLPGEPAAERLHAIVVPDQEVLRGRRVVNTREAIRFDIEGLSLALPHHKRVLSFDVWLDDLPRTTTRKLKRHAIERMYRDCGTRVERPAAQTEWTEEEQLWAAGQHVEAALAAIRGAAKPGSIVSPGANLELDLGLDSMERVELLSSLEHRFGREVPDEVAQRIYTVRELVEAVRPAQSSPGPGIVAPTVDPWARLLAEESVDPELAAVLDPKPLFAPFAFLVMKAAYLFAWLFMGLRVSGRRQIPQEGPFLLSPNHQSYLDAFILVSALPYRLFKRLFFVGASEYFRTPFMAWLARRMNVVPVDPDANLVRAMQAGAFGLRHGRVLVLFPEGERSPDGTVRRFKKGAAILSTQLEVPVVPVAIHGVHEVWPRARRFQVGSLRPWGRARSRMRFGHPLSSPVVTAASLEARYAEFTAILRDHVVRLWNEFDGVAADTP